MRDIPESDWPRFFLEFSRVHDGWLCTLEVNEESLGTEVKAGWLPFGGVSMIPDGRGNGRGAQIFLSGWPQAHTSHTLANPTRVWVEESASGIESGMGVEGASGFARIWFHSPISPDLVDRVP
jgi:hypothetical protein